jgi:RNA polymerase sigma factor (TIGR02999 family)
MKGGELQIESQRHFYALAAQIMRRVLVDYARSKYGREGQRRAIVTIFDEGKHAGPRAEEVDIPALDEALEKLTRSSPRASQIVELRMFSGMEVNEIAKVLDISPATVKRDWAAAKLWLFHEMKKKAA